MEDRHSGVSFVNFGVSIGAFGRVVVRRRVVVGFGFQVLFLRVFFGADRLCFVPDVFYFFGVDGVGRECSRVGEFPDVCGKVGDCWVPLVGVDRGDGPLRDARFSG